MRTSISFTKWFVVSSTVALWVFTSATVSAQSQTNTLRIGVYDSRAVAVAYANSTEWRDALKSVQAEYAKAKTAKDEKRMKEIQGRMKLQQLRMHEQGFSTGSVAGMMAKLKPALSGVASKAGVQAIVSKWELNYHAPAVELVDVTDALVALFPNVSDKGKEWAKQVQTKPPIPMEEITAEMD
jgi:hypothetical protein